MVHIIISGLQLEVSKFIIDNFYNDNSTASYGAKIISELTTSRCTTDKTKSSNNFSNSLNVDMCHR